MIRLPLFFSILIAFVAGLSAEKRPNILFIAVDDLNHWVGYFKRNHQAKTPNTDRLSAMGMSFTNSHCAVPACEPSRAALMSGRRASTSGCYLNGHTWTKHVPEGISLNHTLKKNGYKTYAIGKIYHGHSNSGYASGWDEYPNLTHNGSPKPSKYQGYFEPLPLDMKDEDLPDWQMVDYCEKKLNEQHDEPFFLACGFIKPHLAWAVPKKYYDMFPLESIELPPHKENDLDDVPPAGVKMAKPQGDHAKFLKLDRWKHAVQSYLATIAYCDMNIGRLLDALEKSPHKDNTAIVFWGDHGWSLGEKSHWRKFALWEETTRAPMIWVVPGLTQAGTICDQPVDFMNIFPTLCEITETPTPSHCEGYSMMPLLKNKNTEWNHIALTTHGYKNHSIRSKDWRYTQYSDGSEELYHHKNDPYEYTNLATHPDYDNIKKELQRHLPKINVEMPQKSSSTKKPKKKKV
jgi:arylsulfatase A-like enzyme